MTTPETPTIFSKPMERRGGGIYGDVWVFWCYEFQCWPGEPPASPLHGQARWRWSGGQWSSIVPYSTAMLGLETHVLHNARQVSAIVAIGHHEAKVALLAEAALILEQEGWLIERAAHDGGSVGPRRMGNFAERYRKWQDAVFSLRSQSPEFWPAPPDNS